MNTSSIRMCLITSWCLLLSYLAKDRHAFNISSIVILTYHIMFTSNCEIWTKNWLHWRLSLNRGEIFKHYAKRLISKRRLFRININPSQRIIRRRRRSRPDNVRLTEITLICISIRSHGIPRWTLEIQSKASNR